MADNINTIIELVDSKVLDLEYNLTSEEYIQSALDEFEDVVPNKRISEESVSTGSREFDLPSDFDIGYGMSGIIAVEHPVMVATDSQPRYIFANPMWSSAGVNRYGLHLYNYSTTGTTSMKLRFTSEISSNYKIVYRKRYTVSESESDLPDMFDDILACLAASKKATAIGTRAMQKKDFTRQEDVLNINEPFQEWESIAKNYELKFWQRVAPHKFRLNPETIDTYTERGHVVR